MRALLAACLLSSLVTMGGVARETQTYCGDICQPIAERAYVGH